MADNNIKVELELELKDTMSPVLQSLTQTMDNLNRLLVRNATTSSGAGAMGRVVHATHQLHEEGVRANRTFDAMGGFLGIMGKSLLGPAGFVWGVLEAVKVLEKFALGQAHVRNFARDTGFTAEVINDVTIKFQRAGQTSAEASRALAGFSSMFDNILLKQTSAPEFLQLRAMNSELADSVLDLINRGERWEAVQKIRDDYFANPEGGRYRGQIEALLKTQKSVWEILNDNTQAATKVWIAPIAVMDEYLKRLNLFKTRWKNIVTEVEMRTVFALETDPDKRKAMFDKLRKEEGTVYRPLPALPGSFPQEMLDKKSDKNKIINDIRDIFKRMETKPTARQHGGSVLPGASYLVGEKGPELFESGGKFQMVGEGGPEVIKSSTSGRIVSREEGSDLPDPRDVITARILGKFMPGPVGAAADILKEANPEWRTWARKNMPESVKNFLGIKPFEDNPNEPAPWQAGGEWDKNRMFAGGRYGLEGEGGGETAAANWTALNAALKEPDPLTAGLFTKGESIGMRERDVWSHRPIGGSTGYGRLKGLEEQFERGRSDQEVLEQNESVRQGRQGGPQFPLTGGTNISDQRDLLDMDAGGGKSGLSLNGDMSFDNVPPGVKISAEADGFDNFTKRVRKQPMAL